MYMCVKHRVKIKRNYLKTIASVIIPFMFSGTEKTMRLLNGQGAMKILYVRVAILNFLRMYFKLLFFLLLVTYLQFVSILVIYLLLIMINIYF